MKPKLFRPFRKTKGVPDAKTIKNIHAAMADAGISERQATMAIYNMQQLGIRFSEEGGSR